MRSALYVNSTSAEALTNLAVYTKMFAIEEGLDI